MNNSGRNIRTSGRLAQPAFILILLILFLIAGLPGMLTSLPGGYHFIRQTDSLSFASNYFHGHYPFFSPHVWNLATTDGRAACEFPLIYVVASWIYRITGDEPWVMRSLVLAISFFGFLSAFHLIKRAGKLNYEAILFALPALASTVVFYYSSVPMVDGAALGFSLIGLNLFHRWVTATPSLLPCLFSILCFTIAALLKITFAIWPIACALAWMLLRIKTSKAPRNHWLFIPGGFLLVVLIASGWYVYATHYNAAAGDTYFLTGPRSLTSLNQDGRAEVVQSMLNRWKQSWYPNESWFAFLFMTALIVWKRKVVQSFNGHLVVFGLAGILAYLFLFFGQFRDHDYYFLPVVPLFVILCACAASVFQSLLNIRLRIASLAALTLISVLSIHYSTTKWMTRYSQPEQVYAELPQSLGAIRKNLVADLPEHSVLLVLGDATRNGSLYFLRRKGYTASTARDFETQYGNFVKAPNWVLYPIELKASADSLFVNRRQVSENGIWNLDQITEP